jgi:ArsR family transcriptional regulator
MIELNDTSAELIARRFRVLSEPMRLRILNFLRRSEEASVGELAAALETSQQNVSKHLAALHAEGFVERRKQGTSSLHSIADPAVFDVCDAITSGIEARLEEMEAMLSPG